MSESARAGHMIAYSDGASRGNPGPASCGVIITDENGDELLRRSRSLGRVTNNVAEYNGVITALELAKSLNARHLTVKMDSELVVKQLNGQYKIKNAGLKPLYKKARDLMKEFAEIEIVHVPREQMAAADQLANDELDGKA